jgi:putative ABC transport system substrate-binding protein
VEPALAAIKKQGSVVVIVPASSVQVRRWIADLALKHRLPLASTSPDYVYEGGLIAYTDDWSEVFGRVATYVDRVLEGARPAELPVELPRKFNLIINNQTSKALGLTIPMSIVIRADHVVE